MLYCQTSYNYLHNDNILNEYAIRIPKEYAREESSKRVRPNEVESIPHYEIRIEHQEGTYKTHRDTYLYLKLPESGKYVNIILHPDGGASFDKKFHTWIIRELDEIDRRIILGFCIMYDSELLYACHDKNDKTKDWLERTAAEYKISDMPKRLKSGPLGYRLHTDDLLPIEEQNIFSSVVLV